MIRLAEALLRSSDYQALFEASPTPLIVVAPPDWTIVAANHARLEITGKTRETQIGRRLFDVFPDDPDDPSADGVRNLTASLERVVATRTADTMSLQRYSLQGEDGRFVERWWAPTNTPVLDASGEVALIVHHVEDVTEVVQLRGEAQGYDALARSQQAVIDRLRVSETALRGSEERYLALFNAIDQGFCTIEVGFDDAGKANDYKFLEVSPAFERQTGIVDGIGRWIREIAPEQDDIWFETYGKVVRTGEPARLQNYSTPLDRWWDVYAFRISGHNRVAVLFRDITDQKRAEAAVRESETRFRAMADNAPVMMWVTDSSGFCTHLNARWYEFTGQPPSAGEAYGWLEAVHPEDRAKAEEAFVAANAEHRDYRVDFRLRRADGVYRWTIDAAAARFDANGEFMGYVGSVIDIDERREAEDALRESDARLRALNADLERQVAERALARGRTWQVSPDIFGVVDSTGYFVLSNPAWQHVLGWSEDEVARTPFIDLVHPEDLALTREVYETLLSGDPVLKIENRYRAKDGSYRWLSWVAVPDDGRIYCSARDVTVEKQQAEALAQAEEALRQTQKMEAMGSLTGGVAHDFNNLLTPIIGSLDMLMRRGVGNERERMLIDGALQSAERAKTLVQRLLAFARRQPLQSTAVDVTKLVGGMTELMASTLGPMINLRVDLDPKMRPANADSHQLEMALLNLAVNARDAMPDGGDLTIAAHCQSIDGQHASGLGPGHYIRFSVADTGVGMDEETRARAVEPFFSTKGIGKGTGLGLSMVHGLAAQLGGGLTIESAPGRGTTVMLWLPVSMAAVEGPDDAVEASPVVTAVGTVLLVDDEDLVRISTADMLADIGYDVVEAGSADEAERLIREGLVPDLVVTDHLMPGMTGADLALRLKADHPNIPVLIVSGYAEAVGIDPAIARLSKPFRNAELAASLSQLTRINA